MMPARLTETVSLTAVSSTPGDPVGPVEEGMDQPASTPCYVWGAALRREA